MFIDALGRHSNLQGVENRYSNMINEYSSNREVTKVLDFGNSIWIARDKFDELKDSYREKVSGIYDASIRGFREEDPEGAINDWVKEVTRGKIEKIAGNHYW